MEKLKYARLCSYMEINNVLYKYQFGFRKNIQGHKQLWKSLTTFIIVKLAWEYIWTWKALDTVNDSISLKKLDIYGARRTILKWFTSYLSNRSQYIVLNNRESNQYFVRYGVPPKFIITAGPLLFMAALWNGGGSLYFCPVVTIFLSIFFLFLA